VRVARSPSNAARGKHSPVVISKVVSVPPLAVCRTFAHDPALLDDVKVFNRAIGRLDDALAGRIKTQLTLLNQVRQVRVFHLVEGREALKELQGALDVLQHRGFPACVKASALLITITAVLLDFLSSDDSPWSAPAVGCPLT
jgi:hypothetical protein